MQQIRSSVTEAEVLAMFDRLIALFDNPTPALAAALAKQNNPTDYSAIYARAAKYHAEGK
jgi:hypothetical protein